PTLAPGEIERVAAHGRRRAVAQGEVLLDRGQEATKMFVVTKGAIEVVGFDRDRELVLNVNRPGQFTGELHVLSGRPSLALLRVKEAGEVIEIDRESLRAIVQADSGLSAIFMRAFILRRASLIEREAGDVVLVGSRHSADTLRAREFLTRNGH